MAFSIKSGDKTINFNVPNNWEVIAVAQPSLVPEIPKSEIPAIVKKALLNPIGMADLKTQITEKSTIAIVVDDISRHTPAQLLLEPLIDYLYELKVKREQIRIIFALGMHRDMTENDVRNKIGPRLASEIAWENHNLEQNLVFLGKSKQGTPIYINKNFFQADYKIAIGLIEPHLWAGFSGGAKCVCPGLVGVDTIAVHHKKVLNESVKVGPLVIGNPFRKDIEDIAEKAGLNLILNCILNLDTKICHIIAGDPRKAYQKGLELARPVCEVKIPEIADVIISASYPLGIDFRQSSKAAFNTQDGLRKNGALIVISPCIEGTGNLRASDNPPTIKKIRTLFKLGLKPLVWGSIVKSGYGIEDAAGVFQMFKFIAQKNYIMCSDNLTEKDKKITWMCSHADTIEKAMDLAQSLIQSTQKSAKVKCVIFPMGGVSYPIIQ